MYLSVDVFQSVLDKAVLDKADIKKGCVFLPYSFLHRSVCFISPPHSNQTAVPLLEQLFLFELNGLNGKSSNSFKKLAGNHMYVHTCTAAWHRIVLKMCGILLISMPLHLGIDRCTIWKHFRQ